MYLGSFTLPLHKAKWQNIAGSKKFFRQNSFVDLEILNFMYDAQKSLN
jgi:hypothetical protein